MTSPTWGGGHIFDAQNTALVSKEIKPCLFWNQNSDQAPEIQVWVYPNTMLQCGNSFMKSSVVTKQRKLQVMTFKKCVVGNIR